MPFHFDYFLWYLVSRALELDLGFSHLRSRAGFGLSHTFLIDYTSNDSRWQAYFAGIINTIRVSRPVPWSGLVLTNDSPAV